MTNMDSKERFSGRVDDYIRYRPRYPESLIGVLGEEISLEADRVVADVGSGTGFSAEPFLEYGNMVLGVD